MNKLSHFLRRELTGPRLVFNFLFWGTHLGIFAYGWMSQMTNTKLSILNLLKFSVWISRGAGIVLGVDGFLLLLPVCRNLIRVLRPQLAWLMPLDELSIVGCPDSHCLHHVSAVDGWMNDELTYPSLSSRFDV